VKQLAIISGKGGTGKTSLTAAFASLTQNAVFADCDVDAADLHLILKPQIKKTIKFQGLKIVSIDKNLCIDCKKCFESCRFNAITKEIDLFKETCEGCGVCAYVCPVHAITLVNRDSGCAYLSETRFGPMAHAVLNTAEESSGKLVTLVRTIASDIALERKKEIILIDGPPGIGCPVISSITGVDLVMIITEPTFSAIHDLERVLGVAQHFHIPAVVCINKESINIDNTEKIKQYCKENDIPIVGTLPYDTIVTQAMIREQSVIEFSNDRLSRKVREMWTKILKLLKTDG
jgi:MinD superfamily P-loop ATPase